MGFNVIVYVFKVFLREVFVDRFDFLKQGDIWFGGFKLVGQCVNVCFDIVDIECSDFYDFVVLYCSGGVN